MQQTDLDLARLHSALKDCAVGHTIQYHQSIESTMPLAQEACKSNVPSGMVIVTDQQTHGRGRLNRAWETPFGKAILVGIILGTELLPTEADVLPIMTAVSVRQAITMTAPRIATQILFKWPNDILGKTPVDGSTNAGGASAGSAVDKNSDVKKISGMLVETAFAGSALKYAILGIGINVNQTENELPQNAQSSVAPASLRQLAGHSLDRTELLINLCKALSEQYSRPKHHLVQEWRNHLHTLGKRVTVTETVVPRRDKGDLRSAFEADSVPPFVGTAVDISADGHLVVENAQGERRTFSSGDATLRSGLNVQDDV